MTAIDAESTEVHRGEIVPVGQSQLVALAAPLDQIVAAQAAYHETCLKLLDDNDIQVIGEKAFKKRSAWNKLAVAFGVSTTEVRTVHERDERGRIIRTECVVRAEAPNGRVSDGIGACDRYERCCDPETCAKREVWEDSGKPTGHTHCTAFPCMAAHFSNPQHDIAATAFTRASNRAKADLFGMGEVSAEEVEGGRRPESAQHDSDRATGTPPSGNPGARHERGGGVKAQGNNNSNTEAMRRRIYAVSTSLGLSVADAVEEALGESVDEANLTFAECRKVNDWLSEEEKRQK